MHLELRRCKLKLKITKLKSYESPLHNHAFVKEMEP